MQSHGSKKRKADGHPDSEGHEPDGANKLRSPLRKIGSPKPALPENSYYRDNCNSLYQQLLEQLNQEFLRAYQEVQGQPGEDPSTYWFACEYDRALSKIRRRFQNVFPGQVLTFGSDDGEQLGYNSAAVKTNRPRSVRVLSRRPIVQIACGAMHNLVLDTSGKAYSWGNNDEGATARGGDRILDPDIQVKGFIPSIHAHFPTPVNNEDEFIIKIACGSNYSLFLSGHGNLYCSGSYHDEESANIRDPRPPDDPTEDIIRKEEEKKPKRFPFGANWKPTHLYQIPGKVVDMSSGEHASAAILDNGAVVTWGVSTVGALGRPVPHQYYDKHSGKFDVDLLRETFLRPHPVVWDCPATRRLKAISVACGQSHLVVVARDQGSLVSTVFGSGLNKDYQLGLGDNQNRTTLTPLRYTETMMISEVAAGNFHTLALSLDRTHLYACGRASDGECGNLDGYLKDAFVKKLQLVPFPERGLKFDEIACGESHNIVIATPAGGGGREVYTWGYGDPSGALGHAKDKTEYRPRKLNVTRSLDNEAGKPITGVVRQVAAGSHHTGILFSPTDDTEYS